MEGRRAWGGGDTQRPLRALPSALGLPLCPHGLCFPFSPNQLNPDCHTRPQGAPSLSPEKRGRGLTRGLPGSSAESCEDARRGFLGVSCVPPAPPESKSDVSTTPPRAKVVLPPGSYSRPRRPRHAWRVPRPPTCHPEAESELLASKAKLRPFQATPRSARDPAGTGRSPRKRWCRPARQYTAGRHCPDVTSLRATIRALSVPRGTRGAVRTTLPISPRGCSQ